ncbi:MAG: elongation factor P, partial [Bacteroidota bacterium]|nr:elongation factor P [Bacteroidota bacterium]
YLYEEESGYVFMDTTTYEQVTVPELLLEDVKDLMKEGQEVNILFHAENENPLQVEMPSFIVLEVTYTEQGLRGDTATNTLKPATLETGATINVPLFVNTGDLIKIDTRTSSYVERAKK